MLNRNVIFALMILTGIVISASNLSSLSGFIINPTDIVASSIVAAAVVVRKHLPKGWFTIDSIISEKENTM
jgi:hypothetical protein